MKGYTGDIKTAGPAALELKDKKQNYERANIEQTFSNKDIEIENPNLVDLAVKTFVVVYGLLIRT